MSYNPGTGLVYIPTMVFPVAFLQPTEDKDRLPGGGLWNVGFDRMANVPPDVPEIDKLLAREYRGALIGWDPIGGEARWTQDSGRPNASGTLSTEGGLGAEGGAVAHGWKMRNLSRVLVYKLGGTHKLPRCQKTPARCPGRHR